MLVTVLGIMVFLQPAISVFDDVSIIALQLFRESYLLFPVATEIVVKPLQSEKASLPMFFMLEGIETEVRLLQLKKALFPILVTPSERVSEDRLLQPWKASSPIQDKLEGMTTEVRPIQNSKAPLPMLVTPSEMITEVRPMHFAYLQLVVCQLILFKTVEK